MPYPKIPTHNFRTEYRKTVGFAMRQLSKKVRHAWRMILKAIFEPEK